MRHYIINILLKNSRSVITVHLPKSYNCITFIHFLDTHQIRIVSILKNTKTDKNTWRIDMFRWAIIFAVIALIASLLGFGGVAGLSKDFAVILLVVAVILAIIGFISRGKV